MTVVDAPVRPFIGHVLLDAPAKNPTLKFGRLATALGDIVSTSEPRSAVGIFGGWGCGKSTLTEEIRRGIEPDGRWSSPGSTPGGTSASNI